LTALGAPAPIWAADSSQTATKPPPSSPPIFSWSGFHFGATLGGAAPVSRSETLQAVSGIVGPGYDLNPPSNERAGITFGATLGYNFQNGPIVYGAETELNFLDGRRAPAGTFLAPPAYAAMGVGSYTLTPDEGGNYFASLRGRVGFAYGRALPYLTAGVASGGWRGASTLTLNGGVPGNPFTSGLTASSRMKYVVGAGVDYALFDNWSARAEYLFLDQSLGTQVFDNGNMYDFLSKARTESHIFRLGLIYNLGAATILRSPETKEKDKSADDKKPARAWTLWPNVAEQGVGNKTSTASQSEKINPATPEDTAEVERYSFHGQITVLPQGYPKLNALYTGTNSLPPDGQVRATVSNTAFFGLRLWDGGEAYLNPEIDQGYGLQGTLGVAGFTSAEAYKAGHARPYMRFQRYFIRQTIGLGGESETIDPGQNLLGGAVDANRLTFTVGKYSPPDIFDDNRYAHDGRNGFMNWSVIEMGAFDYAADSWGYTNGATAEWKQDRWTARAGYFQLSLTPNDEYIEPMIFRQWEGIAEFEARHDLLFGQPGKVKFLAYANTGFMGKYDEAVYAGFVTGTTPDTSQDRKKRTNVGGGINVEQPVSDDLGFFLRVSTVNGRYETFDFTEIQRSISGGLVLTGANWDRPKDAIGVAAVANGLSGSEVKYFAAGGLGKLIGDGGLNYNGEHILETYYKYYFREGVHLTGDYQFIQNPAYNKDRGPANIFALRLHAEF
jgi:high affinity Mn2+ porin